MTPDPTILNPDPPKKKPAPLFRWYLVYPLMGLLGAACLLAMLVPRFGSFDSPPRKGTIVEIGHLGTALDMFHMDTHRFPTTAEGLGALVTQPQDTDGWRGPYIEGVPLDKWGHPFIYRCPGVKDPTTFDLLSPGPDGIEGTPDDIDKHTGQ